MRSGLLRVCVLLVALSAGVSTADTVLSSPIEATLQRDPCVSAVEVDFASLLKAAGVAGEFAPGSVEVLSGAGESLPVRIERGDSIYRVAWLVPKAAGAAEVGAAGEFSLRFGTVASGAPVLTVPENLVYNGDFAKITKAGVPEAFAGRDFGEHFRLEPQSTGGNALAFRSNAERETTYTTPWVSVEGKSRLSYEFSYFVKGAKAHFYNLVFYSYAYFEDAEGKVIPRKTLLNSRASDSDGWQSSSYTLEIPENAARTRFEFRSASSVSESVMLRDVRIVPSNVPEVTRATTSDGRVASLRATGAGIHRFDLGPDNSPVMEGFAALTPSVEYTPERGYGFTRIGRPFVFDKTRPDDLGRDFVAALDARMRLDLPDGDYKVWILTGDSQAAGSVSHFYFNPRLRINGEEVYSDDTPAAEIYRNWNWRNYDKFWLPGFDFYEEFLAPSFRELTFDAAVRKGRLEVLWNRMPICGMIVYPASESDAIAGELSWLAGRRRREGRIDVKPGPVEVAAEPSRTDRKRGFALFRRPMSDPVYPTARPQAGEAVADLRTFGAPGQLVTANFSLYPLADLGDVRIRLTDLRGRSAEIGADAGEIRVVRNYLRRTVDGGFEVAPFLLDRREVIPVTKGTTWSWFAQVMIPEGTPGGEYKGSVEVLAADSGRRLASLPLALTVLPIELEPLPILQGYYYFPNEPWYSRFWGANVVGDRLRDDPEIMEIIRRQEARELRFMKSLGLNSVAFGDDLRAGGFKLEENGEMAFDDPERFQMWMDLYTEAGMGAMPFYGFQSIVAAQSVKIAQLDKSNAGLQTHYTPEWNKAVKGLVKDGMRLQRERGWPEILWYLSDELSNQREEGAKTGVILGKLLREVPGATSISSMNGPWEHIMTPYVDISMPNVAFPITDETIKQIRDDGSKLWLYNCGSERLTLGLYPWRVKAGGRFQWHYRQLGGQDWDDLAGRGMAKYAISFSGPDEVVPALPAQIVREAIYDHRYMATLEKALAAAEGRAGDEPALRKVIDTAREFIAYLESRVPVDMREVIGFSVDPREAGGAVGGEFRDSDNLDRVRRSMGRLIVELQEGVRK